MSEGISLRALLSGDFWVIVTQEGKAECFWAGHGECQGRIQAAHWIPKSRLRSHLRYKLGVTDEDVIEIATWDDRNGVPACETHHTGFDSKLRIRPSRDEVPDPVEEFALDYALEGTLDYDYGERQAA